jgi:spore maturation protein CgeB
MARILLSAGMTRPWSPGHGLRPALERTGHTVHVFDYLGVEDVRRELLATVRGFRPNLHVAYGGERYTPDLIGELADQGLVNVLWYPEVTPNPRPEAVELGRAYDFFFTMAEGLVERFQAAGLPEAAWLPEAMEPSLYEYDEVTDLDRELFSCDVTLVGKLESDNPAYMERWKLVKRIVDEGFDIKWWGPRLRRKIGTFVLGLLLSKVSRAYGGRFVWNETYAKAIHLSKVFIARDAYPAIRLSMSARAFTAMGLGAFYLTYPTRGIEELFEPGKELVTFASPDEMVEKIRYYLAHDEEREAIAGAARAKVLGHHTYEHRFRRMFEVLAERGVDLGG